MSRFKPDPALAESLREFYTQILHFLRKRTDNASDAADMTQDVFTQWRATCCAITGDASRCANPCMRIRLNAKTSR